MNNMRNHSKSNHFCRAAGILAFLVAAMLAQPALATNTMTLKSGSGAPGDLGVPVTVTFMNDDDIQAYSIAVTYDEDVFTCTTVTEVGGFEPDYFESTIDNENGQVHLGCILALEPLSEVSIPASPDTEVDMVELLFDIEETTLPGDYMIELTDGVGSPPVDNLYSVGGADVLLDDMISEAFVITNPAIFYFRDITAYAGSTFTAEFAVDSLFDLEAVQVEFTYDETVLTLDSVSEAPTEGILFAQVEETEIEFLEENTATDGLIEVGMIFDFFTPLVEEKVIPAGDNVLIDIRFDNSSAVDDTTDLVFTNDGLLNSITYDDGGVAVSPITEDITITFEEPPIDSFIRGAANSDSLVNLADPIFIIKYQFLDGTEPPCFKAADFNDDGQVDVADAIGFLQWLFGSGSGPDAPYPDCGEDETVDDLDCLTPTPICA